MIWIKNTNGKKDAVLTMALIGFVVVLIKILFSGMTVEIMDRSVNFGSIDGAVVAAILTPTLGAYIARRYTDTVHGDKKKQISGELE